MNERPHFTVEDVNRLLHGELPVGDRPQVVAKVDHFKGIAASGVVIDEAFDGRQAGRGGKPLPRRKPESEVVSEGINHIRSLPSGYARKVHGGAMGNAGEPDVDACVRGRSVKLEAKAGTNKPTQVQAAALRRWAKAGALVGWFTTTQHVIELLDHMDDSDYVTNLDAPGCAQPCHRGRS